MTTISQVPSKVQFCTVSNDEWGDLETEVKHMSFEHSDLVKLPKKEWLVKDLFGSKDIVVLYGQPSTGKTFVAIDLMMKAIDGQKFANVFEATRPLTVAMVVGEGGTSIRDRLLAAYNNTFCDGKNHNYTIFANGLQFYEDDDGEEIDSFVREWKQRKQTHLDLLIVDTYAMSTIGADENSSKATGKVLGNARKIADALGCAIMFVHHTTKNGNSERGSSALRAAADMMIEVSDSAIKCVKAKHCPVWKPINFELVPFEDSLIVEWNNENLLSDKIVEWMRINDNVQYTMKEIADQFSAFASHMIVRDKVNQLVNSNVLVGGLRNPAAKQSPSNPTLYWIGRYS